MTKKTTSLISFILLSIFVTMSCIPCVFVEELHWADTPGRGIYRLTGSYNVNIFSANAPILLIAITLLFAGIGIAALVWQFSKNDCPKIVNTLCFSPIASAVLFILSSIMCLTSTIPIGEPAGTATLGSHGYYAYAPAWGFYIECALLLAVCIMSILVATGKVKNAQKKAENTADELKKYKDLLDNGVITEEEFNAKKKELLHL